MSMLTLNGIVLNVFDTPASTDKKTGEVRPASTRVQIQAENTLENGQRRFEMVTLKVAKGEVYERLVGQPVRIPVGAFVANGGIVYYALNNESVQNAA
jgi:hypothetical protein